MRRVSKAKRKANDKWDEENRERKRYINNRSVARNFIKRMNDEDIPEFKTLLKNRIEYGKE